MAARGLWCTRVCTINHKPRPRYNNAIAHRALFGHILCTWLSNHGVVLLLTTKTDQNLHMRISLKSRERFSWGRRSHSCRCELLSLVVATCVETIADAEQQLSHGSQQTPRKTDNDIHNVLCQQLARRQDHTGLYVVTGSYAPGCTY